MKMHAARRLIILLALILALTEHTAPVGAATWSDHEGLITVELENEQVYVSFNFEARVHFIILVLTPMMRTNWHMRKAHMELPVWRGRSKMSVS